MVCGPSKYTQYKVLCVHCTRRVKSPLMGPRWARRHITKSLSIQCIIYIDATYLQMLTVRTGLFGYHKLPVYVAVCVWLIYLFSGSKNSPIYKCTIFSPVF